MSAESLRGVRVLEYSEHDGASFLGRVMADHGASVTRLVPRERAEPGPGPLAAARDIALHRGKDSIEFAFDAPGAVTAVDELVRGFDVVAVGGWNLDAIPAAVHPTRLSALTAGFVLASVLPYGATGPKRHLPATPLTLSAAGGLMSVTGTPDAPRRPWGRQEPYVAGIIAYTGAVATLLQRDRPADRVAWVDVSVQEAALQMLECGFVFESFLGVTRVRAGATNPLGYPYEVYPCADGYIMASIGHDWEYFADVLGEPGLVDDEFLTLEGRLRNRTRLDAMLTRAFAPFTREELLEIGQAVGCPFGAVYSVLEVPGVPHWQLRNSFRPVEGGLVVPRSPIGAAFHAEAPQAVLT